MSVKEEHKRIPPLDDEEEEYVVIPPDGGWGWVVTMSGFMALLFTDGINICFGLILIELTIMFENESVSKISWVFSILIGIQMVTGPVVSALCNRFGYRIIVILGSLFGFIGLSCSAVAPSVDVLFVTIGVLCGLAFGMVWMPCLVAVGLYFEKRRALATGIVMCGTGVGTFVFAPLTAWLLQTYGLRGTFLILGAIYLNNAIFGALVRPVKMKRRKQPKIPEVERLKRLTSIEEQHAGSDINSPGTDDRAFFPDQKTRSVQPEEPMKSSETAKPVEENSISGLFKFSLFRWPAFVLLCASSFFQLLGMLVPYMYIAARALEVGASKESAAFLLSIIGISGTFGKIAWGFLADHPKISTLLLNNLAMTLCGILIIICPLLPSYEWLVAFAVLLGITDSCFFVLRPILLGELLGTENVNNAFGFTFLFCGIASFIGLPLTGFLYDTYGNFTVPFFFSGSVVLFSAILCYPLNIINRRWRKRNQQFILSQQKT